LPQIAEVGFALSNPYNLLILLKSVTASNAVIVTVHITGIVETINTEKHPVVILERQKLNTIQLLKRIIMPKQNYCLVAKLPKKKQKKWLTQTRCHTLIQEHGSLLHLELEPAHRRELWLASSLGTKPWPRLSGCQVLRQLTS